MGTITLFISVFGRSDKKRQEGPRVFWGGNVTVEVLRYLAICSRDSTRGNGCQSRLIIFVAGGLPVRARKFELTYFPESCHLNIAVRFRSRSASRGALPVFSTCVFAICCEGTRAFTQRSRAHENQLGKSDYYFGERDSGGIAGLGNLPASAIHILIRHAEWGCAPVFAMAAFYHWESALDPAVPVQVHGVPDRAVVFFAFISELPEQQSSETHVDGPRTAIRVRARDGLHHFCAGLGHWSGHDRAKLAQPSGGGRRAGCWHGIWLTEHRG